MIDQDSTILDRVALDLDLYAKPAGATSGRQDVPSLDQIQDVFGAAKQEYRKYGNNIIDTATMA